MPDTSSPRDSARRHPARRVADGARDDVGLVTVTKENGGWIVEILSASGGSRQRFVCADESIARRMQRAFERGRATGRLA